MNRQAVKMRIMSAACFTLMLLAGIHSAQATDIPLPTTPPQVEGQPDSVPEQEPAPEPPADTAAEETPESSPQEAVPAAGMSRVAGYVKEQPLDTASVLMLGGLIWYFVVIVGVTGGRRGRRRHMRPYRR